MKLWKRISGLLGIVLVITVLGAANAAAVLFQQGDVFAGVGNGIIRHYDNNGNFIENLTVPGVGFTEDTGMAFDAGGNLYATLFQVNNVSKFDNTGAFLSFFGSGYNAHPESIVFDAAGNVYVGQADGIRDILKFDSAGNLLATFDPPTGPRGTDWIDLAGDQCTIYYTSEGTSIRRFDVCTNTSLADFAPLGTLHGAAYALRILPDGGVLVADSVDAHRLNASGGIIQTYPLPAGETSFLFALNLDPDGTSFWTAGYGSGRVYKIDISTGNLLLTINTTDQGSIVTLAGLAIFGEPTAAQPGEGRMTGGGSVFNASMRVTHGFELNCDASKTPNSLQVNWGKGNRFHLTNLTSASCTDDAAIMPNPPAASFDTYEGSGMGSYNGMPGATAHWIFADAGEPGTGDTATMHVWDAGGLPVLSVSGNLTNGNNQAHDS